MRMIADRPLTGVGPGNFITASPRYARGMMLKKHLVAHNSYVSVTAETGILGLVLFLALHVLALRSAQAGFEAGRRARDGTLASAALAVEACLLIVMASGMTGSLEGTKFLWIFFGLAVAASHAGRSRCPEWVGAAVDAGATAQAPR